MTFLEVGRIFSLLRPLEEIIGVVADCRRQVFCNVMRTVEARQSGGDERYWLGPAGASHQSQVS